MEKGLVLRINFTTDHIVQEVVYHSSIYDSNEECQMKFFSLICLFVFFFFKVFIVIFLAASAYFLNLSECVPDHGRQPRATNLPDGKKKKPVKTVVFKKKKILQHRESVDGGGASQRCFA